MSDCINTVTQLRSGVGALMVSSGRIAPKAEERYLGTVLKEL